MIVGFRLVAQLRQTRQEALDLREALRMELMVQARADREEAAQGTDRLSGQLTQSISTLARLQTAQIEGFARRIDQLTESNERRLGEVRATLETRLESLSRDNAHQLARMRETVDEKLQSTLEQRLGESFARVAGQLEQMHRGLGEMKALATDVGDLKRVLTNVKTRGTWGEVQLGSLLSQVLAPSQFSTQVITVPGSSDRVEFAVCLPGAQSETVWLPIDAKFPREDWERLQQAHDRADAVAAEQAHRALEQRVRTEARRIRDKYLAPPHTTDFGLLFLPTEGLYAEVARRPGLLDDLQRESR
ncbi:MAG: DNA recombination protein RmuC, partial [Burkholderiales bacterium]